MFARPVHSTLQFASVSKAVAAPCMPVPQRQVLPLATPKYGYVGRQKDAQLLTVLLVAHVALGPKPVMRAALAKHPMSVDWKVRVASSERPYRERALSWLVAQVEVESWTELSDTWSPHRHVSEPLRPARVNPSVKQTLAQASRVMVLLVQIGPSRTCDELSRLDQHPKGLVV